MVNRGHVQKDIGANMGLRLDYNLDDFGTLVWKPQK